LKIDEIINAFDKRVDDYNKIIHEVIPYYQYMLDTIVDFIPYNEELLLKF